MSLSNAPVTNVRTRKSREGVFLSNRAPDKHGTHPDLISRLPFLKLCVSFGVID